MQMDQKLEGGTDDQVHYAGSDYSNHIRVDLRSGVSIYSGWTSGGVDEGFDRDAQRYAGGSAILLGIVIGLMTAFDMGGPINKTASAFTMALMAEGLYGPNGAFRVAVAIHRLDWHYPPLFHAENMIMLKNSWELPVPLWD